MKNLEWKACPKDRDPGVYTGGMRYLINGKIHEWKGDSVDLESPVCEKVGGALKCRNLGKSAMLSLEEAKKALAAAAKAWSKGCGEWPTMSVAKRIACMEQFLKRMEAKRAEVAQLICWEVAKPWKDSLVEFDRTVDYGRATIQALKELDRTSSRFVVDGGFFSQIRRSPLGVTLCLGPFNYPLNETYTTVLPALIMGNPVIMKPPRAGIFCHFPILEAFAESFPPGVVNIITGDGAKMVQPLVETGDVDTLAFIGSAHVANILKKVHPRPNRLRCILGLGAKNLAVVFADTPLEETVKECVEGALTFNGQRCTALKIFFVQRAIVDQFVARVAAAVEALPHGMPFEDQVVLTPLPGGWAVDKMKQLLQDATSKGARIVNPDGGATDRTFFHPAVLYPVTPRMDLWRREQFGPIVPIAPFDDPREILDYLVDSPHGQQAAIFGDDPKVIGPLIDAMANQVCRVNLNSQCRRGPDSFPFGGRKDSAEGTLSISDALRVFSIRSLVAAKYTPENTELAHRIVQSHRSQFLTTDYLF